MSLHVPKENIFHSPILIQSFTENHLEGVAQVSLPNKKNVFE